MSEKEGGIGLIDMHCHILPEGEGKQSLTKSLAMAAAASKQGIRQIIAIPHYEHGTSGNTKENIIKTVDTLNQTLKQEEIPVEILPGQQTAVYRRMLEDLKEGTLLPLNGTAKYIFIELPHDHLPDYMIDLLFDMQIAGFIPVISGPERNEAFVEDPGKLYELVKNGALTQISAASLLGIAGKRIQKFANRLIPANMAHFIASCDHDAKKNPFPMPKALRRVRKKHGSTISSKLITNSEAMMHNGAVNREQPIRLKEKRRGLF
jgi:protein-tyrosine phosphatase